MSVETIPQSFMYHCDGRSCHGARDNGPARIHHRNATGHYTDGRPEGWFQLRVRNNSGTNEALLCPDCWSKISGGISHAMTMPEELVPGIPP